MDTELPQTERDALWETIALVRDAAPRLPDDADTDAIIDAILDSGLLFRVAMRAKAEAWDERGRALPQYLGPDGGHFDEDCMGWSDCHCGAFPNPYRDS